MASTRAAKQKTSKAVTPNFSRGAILGNSQGIAIFMVIASVASLAMLVTEFVYIAQISQSIAFGGLDQTKAHYLAKSGLKLSLLRLKAYQIAQKMLGGANGGAAAAALGGGSGGIPKGVIEKIWNFPIFYPLPTNIPGMNSTDKSAIEKFQKESNLEGKFSINIESESSKYNLNLLLAGYVPQAIPSPSASTMPTGGPSPTASPAPFDPQEARNSLKEYLGTILNNKFESDPDFASNYRDFRIDDFIDAVAAWADRSYERRTANTLDKIPMKRAPFYSLNELHMVPMIDEDLYRLFAPALTVDPTPGINVNTMKEPTLRAIVPQITKDEVTEFFKYRDSDEVDNLFPNINKFYEYLQKEVAFFKGSAQAVNDLKERLAKRNIYLVTEESQFKITVRAEVGHSVRTIEAWVTLGQPKDQNKDNTNQPQPTATTPPTPPQQGLSNPPPPDSGLRITFMRIT